MSDSYKVIRKAKEAALSLRSQGWSHNAIASEIGITHALLNDIQEYDPVSVKVRTGTIEKLRVFVDKYEKGIEKPLRKSSRPEKSKVTKGKPFNEFQTVVPESMADSIPESTGIVTGPKDLDGNLLNDLNLLAGRFEGQGYRLNANIELIHDPE